MTEKNIKPLDIKFPLDSNPEQAPKFAVDVMLADGSALQATDPRATRAMVACMDMAAVIGGAASHWGGPAAFAELMSATWAKMFHDAKTSNSDWFDRYHFVNDAGHCENGIYALKANYSYADLDLEALDKFRSIESPLTGHGEVHLFPRGVFISNGPLGSGLPQAQGLAMADSLSGTDRVTICAISDGASFEGEAKEAFAAIAGLAAKGQMAPFVAIVSDNNTKLSGRIDQDAFSMQGYFESLQATGWKVFRLETGNDLQSCMTTMEEAIAWSKNNPTQPALIHAKTIKGFGVKSTEESASGGHGFPLKKPQDLQSFLEEIYSGDNVPEEFTAWANKLIERVEAKSGSVKTDDDGIPSEKVQKGISAALINGREKGYPIISITSDLPGSTGLDAFRKKFPEASFDVGVAESNMVSAAIGMSKSGYIPVVDTFAQFGVTKGALPLIMSSLSEGPMICVYSHTGFQDAADGASHQALSYFAMTCSVPNVDVYCVSSSDEANALLGQALDNFHQARQDGKLPRSSVFFLGRENFKRTYDKNLTYNLGKSQIVWDNSGDHKNSVTVVAAGSMVPQALTAAKTLAADGIGCVVVNPSTINNPDVETVSQALTKTSGRLVTVEDHQKFGGMASHLTHHLSLNNVDFKLKSLGVPLAFGQSAYQAVQLYQKYNLDSAAIVAEAKKLV